MEKQRQIFLIDNLTPEDTAMLQALYSRSADSVAAHLDKVKTSGSGKFMEKFYVGYGHDSIADCGSTTLFIENISILADKVIQDWPLYSGQETSTRYVDMARQPIIDPLDSPASRQIIGDWMDFYISAGEPLQAHLRRLYPRQADENETVYERATKARAFDILRAWLPAGITTQLSWHTNLRQAKDKLALLSHHPLREARDIADELLAKLRAHYPASFSHQESQEQAGYRQDLMQELAYYQNDNPAEFACQINIDKNDLAKYSHLINSRPPKTCLPIALNELGNVRFDFLLDYGSFRDLQRHRNGVCHIPLLTTKHGFHDWYLNELPTDLRQAGLRLLDKQIEAIKQLPADDITKQYYSALGFLVPCRVAYPLMPAVYTIELRSGQAVHPTMRQIAHQMYAAVSAELPALKMHVDLSPAVWDIKRGLNTITEKKSDKIVIGLVGEKGAGKGTVADYLKERYGAEHFGTSKILKRTVEDLHLNLTRDNLIKLALVLKEGFGAAIVINSLIHDIESKGQGQLIIADGIRMHDDVQPFRELYGENFYLIYVTADMHLRYERTKARKEKIGEDTMSFQQFLAEEARLTEVAIHEVGLQANFTVYNNGTPAELTSQLDQIMESINSKK